ncbi:hypothetical protein PYW08_014452 [Mythimna loreyi]|uniref:Uncharacterized protein n=1 Tax=Mythimna loreyi TaxID=667449 RepID=A0ACC2R376_9NEOP|nr:hypothetical protein PYW08_014452 [Mythimna loreyi]
MLAEISSWIGIVYDSYDGIPIRDAEIIQHTLHNTTFWCINDIEPCNPEEWRRLDGSCNNLRHPTRGATHTPQYRMLPADYDTYFDREKSKSSNLPLVRRLRTSFLPEGKVADETFTMLASYFLLFVATDIANLHDTVNYIQWTPHCCTPKGNEDSMCAPIEVPPDDPLHRFTGIRCLNLTKPLTFQTVGCRRKDTPPERIQSATPLFDLSTVYGNSLDKALAARTYKGGLLKYEVEGGRIWPPQDVNNTDCFLNRKPRETRCHRMPSDETNTLIPINLVSIWFWRLHNYLADRLAKINQCWSDERLFYTARDINIAVMMQIFLYELLPMMMGFENLVHDGVLYPTGFRDLYNDKILPQLSMEFPMALRWLHKMQEGTLKLYDAQGNFVKKVNFVDLTIRTGYLAVDNNIDYLTQGSFRQASGKMDDNIVDPDMAEKVLGYIQPSQDVFSNDLAKNRLMFMQPYVKYLEYFSGRKVKYFDHLADLFEPEILEKLSEQYESVENIDLLAAMWLERTIKGGRVPFMFYSIVVEQLIRTIQSDRHWYERPNRPHAFTSEQLYEIRKVTIARFLCDVGDSVTHIQPKAFQRIGPGNEMRSCEEIPEINLMAWKEDNPCF